MADPFAISIKGRKPKNALAGLDLIPLYNRGRALDNSEFDMERAITHAFMISSWVNFCITGHMRSIASVPVEVAVRQRSHGSNWEVVEEHDMKIGLLDKPNKSMTGRSLRELWVAHGYLGGNGMWRMAFVGRRTGKVPGELWPLYPWKARPVSATDLRTDRYFFGLDTSEIDFQSGRLIVAYEWQNGTDRKLYPAEAVMHSMFTNPGNFTWGMGRLQGAARIVDMDVAAVKWQMSSLYNRAMPPGMFSFKSGTMNREKLAQARDFIREHLQSGPDGSINPLVLGNDASYFPINRSPIEMDYNTTRGLNAVEVGMSFGYPAPLISTDAATYNNMGNAYRHLWENERIPTLEMMIEDMNRCITPYFDSTGRTKITYKTESIKALRENRGELVKALNKMVLSGVPLNVALQFLEMEITEIEGGEVALVPKNLVPLKGLVDRINQRIENAQRQFNQDPGTDPKNPKGPKQPGSNPIDPKAGDDLPDEESD